MIAEKLKVQGQTFSTQAWHSYFKQRFLGIEEIRMPNGRVVQEVRSTADLSVPAFGDYMTQVEAWAADHHVFLDE